MTVTPQTTKVREVVTSADLDRKPVRFMVDVDTDVARQLADEWAAELDWLADR